MSLPVRGAWVEIRNFLRFFQDFILSLPVRGAWVEIFTRLYRYVSGLIVAPRAGSVG